MKRISYILVLLALATNSFAAELTGKVIDFGTKKAIDFANVSVMQGGQLITGSVTDATGSFALELKDGSYTVVVSFMGYSEVKKEVTVSGKELNRSEEHTSELQSR